jgi:hypothetical protein
MKRRLKAIVLACCTHPGRCPNLCAEESRIGQQVVRKEPPSDRLP